MSKDMTTGKPLHLILPFALPLLLGNLFQQVYSMADTAIVGRFIGKEALAAVGATVSVSGLVLGFAIGIAAGFGVLIASRFGAKDYEGMRRCAANIIYLSAIIAAVMTVASVLLARPLLGLMKTPDDIIDLSCEYLTVLFCGITASVFYNVLAYVLRALGDSRSPLYFLIVSSVLNILLDLLFVALIPMGVAGAALATVLSQAISAISCLIYIYHKVPILRLQRKDMRPSLSLMGKLLCQGIPMAFQLSLTAIGAIILQSAVNDLGSDVVAAVTVGYTVQLFAFLPLESLGLTMTTYCSQNLGAGKIDRIRRGVHSGLVVALACSFVGAGIIFSLGDKIALLFFDASEATVLANVCHFLRVGTFFYPVLAIMYIYRNSVQGLGYSFVAMGGGMIEMVTRVTVATVFVPMFKFNAACIAQPTSWIPVVLAMIPSFYLLLRKEGRKRMEEGTQN